ncbi:MAG: RND family transporter [Pseudomonadales bacterium]|nr:RND family transporter [Pseudomonadales bacterium]
MSYPKFLLLMIFIIVAVLSIKIPQLQIDASSDSLVLQGDKSLEVYRQVSKRYGSSDFVLVTYSPHQDLYAEKTLANIAVLQAELEQVDGVESVVSFLDVPLLYSPKVNLSNFNDGVRFLRDADTDRDLARKEFLNSPVYKQLLTSQSEKTTALQVNITSADNLRQLRNMRDELRTLKRPSAEQRRQLKKFTADYELANQQRRELEKNLVASVRAVLEKYRPDAKIFLGGVPMIISDMLDFVRSDMLVFGSAILVFIVVSLALIFRKKRWVFLPLLTCFLTCTAMLGGIAWAGVKMTVISANFVALLLIITLSITIHLVVRFIEYEKNNPDMDQFDLVMRTMRSMVKPCTYTTMTTMVAFLSLVVSGIKPVIDFGWMMTIAVALALTIGFFVLPAGLLLMPRSRDDSDAETASKFTKAVATFTERQGKRVIVFACVLLLVSIAGMAQLKVENRFIDYFHKDTEIYQGMLEIDTQLGGTLPMDIVIDHVTKTVSVIIPDANSAMPEPDDEEDTFSDDDFFAEDDEDDDFASEGRIAYVQSYWFTREGMLEIKKVQAYLQSKPSVGKVLSLATLYDVIKDIAGENVDDIQLAIFKENLSEQIDKALVKPYLSEDGTQTRISLRIKETDKSLNRSEMIADVKAFLQDDMAYKVDEFEVTGMIVLYNNMLQSLFTSQIATLAAVFVAIMLMFAVLFRSITLSLIAIAPNILAALLILGGMGWAGIPLDIMTITIAAITVGIGVDDTIHYIHRFQREFEIDGDYVQAMYRCHASIGRAMYYTSVTIIIGFSILSLSNFTPSIYFGVLTSLAMFAALVGALVLLPQLLITFKPLNNKKTLISADQIDVK